MSLRSFISRVLGGPRTLRNRVGGLAMIHGLTNPDSATLNGRIVVTVRANAEGYWVIEPPQSFTAALSWRTISGETAVPGDRVQMIELADEHLRPMRAPRAAERSQEREFQPPVPKAKERA